MEDQETEPGQELTRDNTQVKRARCHQLKTLGSDYTVQWFSTWAQDPPEGRHLNLRGRHVIQSVRPAEVLIRPPEL